ncbi:NINE protein [Bacillus hominis]|uniref:NINE protein n=1 Tax=Bacillus hominis TaxID=2817478 RepID=UPI0025A06819|nr:NINE protein [Bacillus hominis]MDM5432351.1 NINE protein [Bacillus hominis]
MSGVFGAHKFYVGKPLAGLLRLVTLNFLFVGLVFDIFKLGVEVELYNAKKINKVTKQININMQGVG